MVEFESSPGRICFINREEFLFFSGYSYLGINHIEEFRELVKEGVDKYGILFPSSRISNTRLKLYGEFENDLSELTGMQDTVSFSSGFLAGITITDILSSYKNVFTAPYTHPSCCQILNLLSSTIFRSSLITFFDVSFFFFGLEK